MSKNKKALFSNNTDNWKTPKNIYQYFVDKRKCIDLFPYMSNKNQYELDYYNQDLFCNPPYSEMNIVVNYLVKQIENGCRIYLLVPSRTDTKWFHYLAPYITVISYFKGRLNFNDTKNKAPFPSMILILESNLMFTPYTNFDPYSYFGIQENK